MTPITVLGSRYGIQGALGRSVKRAAAGGWWLSGGIAAANCIAAYQPKGAANYAASLVNLANPGTYNAYAGNAPDWDASHGWIFNGINDYLKTGIIPGNVNWSYIFQYSDPDSNSYKRWWGCRNSTTGTSVGMENRVGNSTLWVMNGGTNTNQKSVTSTGGLAICGDKLYEPNGTVQSLVTGDIPQFQLFIGAANHADIGTLNPKGITFISFSIYDTVLSATQIAAVFTAMAAL